MKKGKTINIQGTLLDYFSDESSLNTLVLSRSSTQFTSYAPDSLKKLGEFWIEKRLNNYPFHIDEDFLFIPLGTGELVAIDKFSGIEMILFDLGSGVPVGVCNSPHGIFVLTLTSSINSSINPIISFGADKIADHYQLDRKVVRDPGPMLGALD